MKLIHLTCIWYLILMLWCIIKLNKLLTKEHILLYILCIFFFYFSVITSLRNYFVMFLFEAKWMSMLYWQLTLGRRETTWIEDFGVVVSHLQCILRVNSWEYISVIFVHWNVNLSYLQYNWKLWDSKLSSVLFWQTALPKSRTVDCAQVERKKNQRLIWHFLLFKRSSFFINVCVIH